MTPGEREEIREIALKEHPACIEDIDNCSIYRAILTQVEKARAEERERCAKIAEMYVIEFGNTGMHFKTLHGDKIASAIRDKLEKE